MASSRGAAFFGDAQGIVLAHRGNRRHGVVVHVSRAQRSAGITPRVVNGSTTALRMQPTVLNVRPSAVEHGGIVRRRARRSREPLRGGFAALDRLCAPPANATVLDG